MHDRSERILKYLDRKTPKTVNQIADYFLISPGTARKHINQIRGCLIVGYAGRSTTYRAK
jgi:predicted ArsR family transcriptional regulator